MFLMTILAPILRKGASLVLDKKCVMIYEMDLTSSSNSHVIIPRKGDWVLTAYDNIAGMNESIRRQIEKSGQFDVNEMKARFSSGNSCFIVTGHDGRVLNYSWVCYREREIEYVDEIIHLKDSEAFIFNCYTFREYRGLSVYPWALVAIQSYLKSHGYQKVYIDASTGNMPSVRGIEKSGFRLEAKLVLLTFFKCIKIRRKVAFQIKG